MLLLKNIKKKKKMKQNIKVLSIIVIGALLLTGCSQNTPEPKVKVEKKQNFQIFRQGMVLKQEKVLISSKYETFLNSKIKIKNDNYVKKTLYRTFIGNEDKNFVIFINKKLGVGSFLQFIKEKDGSISHLMLKN